MPGGQAERVHYNLKMENSVKRRILMFASIAFISWLAAPCWLQAQEVRAGTYYNPYTANSGAARQAYNPYTGRDTQEATKDNRYTGRDVTEKTAYNPYTGRSAEERTVHNPYTGRTTTSVAYRRR